MRLGGGLGNQLFHYCFARSLSKDLNEELLFDISGFDFNCSRHEIYGLNSFNIKGIFGNYPVVKNYNYFLLMFGLIDFFKNNSFCVNHLIIGGVVNVFMNYFENLLNKIINRKIDFYFKESDIFDFNKDFSKKNKLLRNVKPDTYLHGVFQFYSDSKNRLFITERFFNNILDVVHDDLRYVDILTNESKNIVDDMENYDSILLHVRHGDYGDLLDFGFCSKEYYEKSINLIASKLNNPKFFIFSDDIDGAKEMLNINYPKKFVDFKENDELFARGNGELLKLMSSCKHFIIANSTLSWWAAFLSENKDKMIITPEPWFQCRRVMGVETIDGKEPIRVINNNSEIFNNSKKLISKLNENEFLFKNLKFDKIDNSYKIFKSNKNSKIILKNKNDEFNQLIIKISLQSNCFNCFRIFFKTKDKNKYCIENSFKLFYYDGDNFDQYLILPKEAILNELKIVPAYPFKSKEDYVIIKSFEIKEIN